MGMKACKRFLLSAVPLLTAVCVLLGGCGADNARETGDTQSAIDTQSAAGVTEEQTAAAETAFDPALSIPGAIEREDIMNHEKILLWPEDHIPYLIEDDKKGLMPTIRAYLCEGADSCVVIFPGGGYFQLSDESEGVEVAKAYNAQGFSAFVVNYRYEPYDGRATLADAQRAIQYVRYYADDFGIDPDKIALCGFSAGGHLAVMTAEHPAEAAENLAGDRIGAMRSTPDLCILAYPVTTLGDGTYETMPRIFLGDQMDNADEIAKYSYPYNLSAMPSTFVFYSVKDTTVDFEKNSIAFADAMRDIGGDVVFKEYADAGHGVGLGTQYKDFSAWIADSSEFMRERGF
ncbi:MAG: alpha/beta hydrolase [Eubacteriales bacterium]